MPCACGPSSDLGDNLRESSAVGPGPPLPFCTERTSVAIATHTASDIVLSAFGRNAALFTGVMDNTDVFFKVMRIALGDKSVRNEVRALLGSGKGDRDDEFDSD